MKKINNFILIFIMVCGVIGCTPEAPEPLPLVINAPLLSVEANQNDDNRVKLTITSQNDRDIHKYKIYRNTQNDLSTKEEVFSVSDITESQYIYDDSLTETGIYYYWVAEEIDGTLSEFTSSGEIYFRYISYISVPQNLEVVCEKDVITATWEAPATGNASYYYVYMKNENDYDYKYIKEVSTTSVTINLTDNPSYSDLLLTSGKKDLVVVAIASTGEESNYSDKKTFWYEYNIISTPKNLRATVDSTNSDNIILNWDSVIGADYYNVYYYSSNRTYDDVKDYDWEIIDNCTTTTFEFNLSKIKKHEDEYYSVTVSAVDCNENEGSYADLIKLDITSPIISDVSFNEGVISINWYEPYFGDAIGYDIYVSNSDKANAVKVKSVSSDCFSTTISYKDTPTLDGVLSTPGKKFVLVSAVNSVGIEAYSDGQNIDYLVIPAISEIQSSLDDSGSLITLNWDEPEYGDPVEYDIYIRGNFGSYALENYVYIKTVNTTTTTLSSNDTIDTNDILDDKDNNYIYFAIKSRNDVGIESAFPEYKKTSGNPNPCYVSKYKPHPEPKNPCLELNEENKLVLSWDPVGNADHYIVCYTYDNIDYSSSSTQVDEDYHQRKISETQCVLTTDIFSPYLPEESNYRGFAVIAVDKYGTKSVASSITRIVNTGIFNIVDLSDEEMSDDNLYRGILYNVDVGYYIYKVKAGDSYRITWASQGDCDEESLGRFACPVSVTAYYANEFSKSDDIEEYIVKYQNYGYKTPVDFVATKDDFIIVEVRNRGYNSQNTPGIYDIGIYKMLEN